MRPRTQTRTWTHFLALFHPHRISAENKNTQMSPMLNSWYRLFLRCRCFFKTIRNIFWDYVWSVRPWTHFCVSWDVRCLEVDTRLDLYAAIPVVSVKCCQKLVIFSSCRMPLLRFTPPKGPGSCTRG